MADPSVDVQIALIAKLDSVLDCDVWDAVPQGSAYPYVTIDTSESITGTFNTLQTETRFIYLGIWSRSYGQAELLGIMSQIRDGIHEQDLSLGSGIAVSVRVERTRTVREDDNLTYMGQVTLRVITQHS